MAQINFNVDVKIKVLFPFVTKSLRRHERDRVNASGAFTYTPKPQIGALQSLAQTVNFVEDEGVDEKVSKLKTRLGNIVEDLKKIKKAIKKRSRNIYFEYEPTLNSNEIYADAEETIFGFASGKITYDMYESLLDFETKLDKWIGQKSIANGGTLNGA